MGHSRTFLLGSAASQLSASGGNLVEIKNGTTAQELRIYGSTTGPHYLTLSHNGSTNAFIGTNDDVNLVFTTNSTTRWFIAASNFGFFPGTDNSVDIGGTSLRVRMGYFGGLSVREGTNATMGVVTLSGAGGSAIVYTTKLVAGTRIFLTEQNSGGTPGVVRVTTSVTLVSFTITSSSITDTSVVAWWLVVPN